MRPTGWGVTDTLPCITTVMCAPTVVLRIVTVEDSGPMEACERLYTVESYTQAILLPWESLWEKEQDSSRAQYAFNGHFHGCHGQLSRQPGLDRRAGSGYQPIPGLCPGYRTPPSQVPFQKYSFTCSLSQETFGAQSLRKAVQLPWLVPFCSDESRNLRQAKSGGHSIHRQSCSQSEIFC